MNLCDRETLRALLERHGFHFSKSMGQNFLIDPEIPRRIAEASGADKSCGVLEIGPGVGVLTRELAARAGKVAAVELDRSLLPVLAETLADCPNAEVVPGDALRLDLGALAAEKFQGLRPVVCANLPYNITTPVLTRLTETPCFGEITVMVQREVAQRICAKPGTEPYGAFTLLVQWFTRPEILFDIPPDCFEPQPKVMSSAISLVRREAPPASCDERLFFAVVRSAFAQRRKKLSNALSAGAASALPKEEVADALEKCGVGAGVRGETLGIPEFAAIADELRGRGL